MDKVLLRRLVSLARDVPMVANSKSLMAVENNGFTGVRWDDVPQMDELSQLESLGYIRLIPASGNVFDILIDRKAVDLFD